jgi:hypothetical protein
MSLHSNNTKPKKYSPPSTSSINNNNNNKKNKKYDNDINLFPVLLKEKDESKPQKKTSTLAASFASLVNNEIKKETIKESNNDNDNDNDEPPAGWVYIKKINGKINYKYGIMSDNYVNMILENKRQEKEYNKTSFKKRLAQLQWDQDILNDLLGDISPYWKSKTLYETYNLEHLIKKKKNVDFIDDDDDFIDDVDFIDDDKKYKKEEEWIYIN